MIRVTQTIPELLANRSQGELARQLGVNRATVKKYAEDRTGANHIVINGRLMVAGRRERNHEA
ncbi:protein ninH [Enterobacteriaceae bacterium 4M9]|nr:protein ninH [Enterobacteriaceae bacterium 4M9]